MPDVSYLVEMITGVPVVTPPAEIDLTTADRFRLVLLEAAALGGATVVVDMTHTKFCDSAGLSVLARAHKQALEGVASCGWSSPRAAPCSASSP